LAAQFKTVCEEMPGGHIKLKFPKQEAKVPEVWTGVENFNEPLDQAQHHPVDYILTHVDGYLGGGKYGEYGGYDIILIKVTKAMKEAPICLPGPKFEIKNPMIGGYGRYRRIPCEVNSLGPNTYQYCQVNRECSRDTHKFRKAQCEVQFNYKGQKHAGCNKRDQSPSSENPECLAFREATQLDDSVMTRTGVDEVIILDENSNKILTKCYRFNAGKYGWCGVSKHIFDGKFAGKEQDAEILPAENWGVCSETCPHNEEALTGIARIKSVSVINQDYCDEKLLELRYGRTPFKVFPQVFCVAHNETYNTAFYTKQGVGTYMEIKNKPELHQDILGRKQPWVIRATGSCKGDSGGPLFEQVGKKYVLLGSTSRGTGVLSNCGGADNPTHYVRVDKMLGWIMAHVPKEDICMVNENV